MYLYLKCSAKWAIRNTKFLVINQCRNYMCHVKYLENDFYLGALARLTMISRF